LKFIFIDAENIGLKEIEKIEVTMADKVFVFSKNESIKELCERKLFLYISSYPTGPNQADFYIIGNLVGIISSIPKEQKPNCEFILYSRDNPLVDAFVFQCNLHKTKHKITLEPKIINNVIQITQESTLDQRILDLLKNPMQSETLRKKLKEPKPDFTRALNILIKEKRIQRSPNCKKSWAKVKSK